jgi:cellulose synthase/poly-beta-1,6-N-acetylglucosamine synthase-like glycosyltransferase
LQSIFFLFFIIYFKNKKKLFYYPPVNKEYEVSFIVPCYNEEESIGETIEKIMDVGYNNLKKIIVVE